MTEIGLTQKVKIVLKINRANKKFITTHASMIIIFLWIGALIKLSFAWNSSGLPESSHLSLTNHPNGIQFKVYSVHDLSFHNLHALGGIPTPNSNTLTQDFLAARKCHNSCMITSHINIKIHIIKPVIIILKI